MPRKTGVCSQTILNNSTLIRLLERLDFELFSFWATIQAPLSMRVSAAKTICGLLLGVVLVGQSIAAQSSQVPPPNAEIREVLAERIDTLRQSVGIVVGIIEPGGRRVVTYGELDSGDPRPLDGDTVFEIGSITKIFT